MIHLINHDGRLATPASVATKEFLAYFSDPAAEARLLAGLNEYGEGVTIHWSGHALTREQNQDLSMLLYGAREVGQIPADTKSVMLPSGVEFTIDD